MLRVVSVHVCIAPRMSHSLVCQVNSLFTELVPTPPQPTYGPSSMRQAVISVCRCREEMSTSA